MIDLDFKYQNLIKYIKDHSPFDPEISLILGSGLGDFANNIEVTKSIATSKIPNYPLSTVEGHEGYLHFAQLHGKNILIFQGRIHLYEGYSIDKCLIPAFIAHKLNSKKILITNAAGGVNLNFKPGDLMLVTGFLSHNVKMELSTIFSVPNVEQRNFMTNMPSQDFNSIIKKASVEEKVFLKEGTYWFGKGPSYETPAEVRMQGIFGADAVGMSTVHEAVYAAYNGMQVSSISLITNHAAGLAHEKLSHQEVMETAEFAKDKFERLVKKIIALV